MKEENSKVQSASEALQKLVAIQDESKMTKREIVLLLKKDIVKARAAGKTWKEIVDALRSVGVEVTAPHIKSCIQVMQNKPADKSQKQKTHKPNCQTEQLGVSSKITGLEKIRPDNPNL